MARKAATAEAEAQKRVAHVGVQDQEGAA
jgi:hypothetical protein